MQGKIVLVNLTLSYNILKFYIIFDNNSNDFLTKENNIKYITMLINMVLVELICNINYQRILEYI